MASTENKETGFQAGDYRAEVKIGEGGMGEVWRGTQPKIKKQVAIKVLNKKLLGHDVTIARFKREALAVNTVRNRHIVDIFATGELEDGRPYMVMEYLSGVSLGQHMKKKGPLPFSEIVELFGQLCKGLQAAHEAGIIHRDLKPDNIFLVLEDGEKPFVKILDFGIAKVAEGIEEEDQDLTAANTAFGTPAYMSPEQCKGAKEVDHRTDIYALGIILYKLITNRTPFSEPGDNRMAIMIKQSTIPPIPLRECVSGRSLPEGLEEFMQKVLAKYPGDRPSSCLSLFDQLSKIVKSCWSPALDEVEGATSIYKTAAPNTADTSQSLSRVKLTGATIIPPQKPARTAQIVAVAAAVLLLAVIIGVTLFPKELEKPTPTPTTNPPPKTAPVKVVATLPASQPKTEPATTPTSTSTPSGKTIKLTLNISPDGFNIVENIKGTKKNWGTTTKGMVLELPYKDEDYKFILERECFRPYPIKFSGTADFTKTVALKKVKMEDFGDDDTIPAQYVDCFRL